jgi:hypothetical protein
VYAFAAWESGVGAAYSSVEVLEDASEVLDEESEVLDKDSEVPDDRLHGGDWNGGAEVQVS